MTEHTFSNEDDAREACMELIRIGWKRNNGVTVAFRDGCTVCLRPEYASQFMMEELANIAKAF